MKDCLVYFFNGFLDSGKTSLICTWAGSDDFRKTKLVILATEEGEIEYDDDAYPGAEPIVIIKEPDEITSELMFAIEKEHKPDFLFIEWNGSVSPSKFFDETDVPRRWMLAASIVVVDASTYGEFFRNMQPLFADYYKYGDNILFNRVDPEVNSLPKLRASVKAINPGVNIAFFGEDNEPVLIEDHLPYNLEDNPCLIKDEDFGIFYTDMMDNVNRYNGKRVSLVGRAVVFREMRGKGFALSRPAYTCCSNDIGQIQLLCLYNYKSNFPANEWVKVTGRIRYFEQPDPQTGKKVPMGCLEVENYVLTSKPEVEMVYFS
ncbi:MAG: hypothetical protein MJ153_06265 [Clostridia bacterium]|nr:hypothetical protein [Clostridia bacterium]